MAGRPSSMARAAVWASPSSVRVPSVVFLLGTRTELGDAHTAALAIDDGRPAIVEVHEQAAFLKALQDEEAKAAPAGEVKGLDYSKGKPVDLVLYRAVESGGAP